MTATKTLAILAFLLAAAPSAGVAEDVPVQTVIIVVTPADPVDLTEFLWTKRPIVVFADTPADPRFEQQMQFLQADPDALSRRDIVVLTDTDPAAKGPLRLALRPHGFGLVLIDKDGEVKLRKPLPSSTREITRSIDKWPSRLQEIRDGLGKK
jgi:hypothetical protein